MTLLFFFGFTEPAVAVTVTGSPGNTAGGFAFADRVMGGAFLQPMGNMARLAATASRQAERKSHRFISSP
jgi:hypothetical protein